MNKEDQTRWLKAAFISTETFPRMLSDMISNSSPPIDLDRLIRNNPSFQKLLSSAQRKIVGTLQQNGFQKFDTSLFYKCIRYFRLVEEPSNTWEKAPKSKSETTKGDDVVRLYKIRNSIFHTPKAVLSEGDFTKFLAECDEVAQRLDIFLQRPVNGFQKEIRDNAAFQSMNIEDEKKYLCILRGKEREVRMIDSNEVTLSYPDDVVELLNDETPTERSFTMRINGLSQEHCTRIEEFVENMETDANISINKVEIGSIILHVTIHKKALKDKTCLNDSLFGLMKHLMLFIGYHQQTGEKIKVELCVADYNYEETWTESLVYLSDTSGTSSYDCKVSFDLPISLVCDADYLHGITFKIIEDAVRNKENGKDTKNNQQIDIFLNTKDKDEPPSKPPVVPKRQKGTEALTKIGSKDLIIHTYGNTNYNVEDVKKESLEVKESEEPTPGKDTDESHIYDYVQDKYVTYIKPIVRDKIQPAESRGTELAYKPALPKRPPPPSWPVRSQSKEKPQIRNDEDSQQMASLYGKRDKNEIRFVMVGRTGSGKSATGNTIMAKAGHFDSVTSECQRGECIQAGRKIVLVDTPGLFDTQLSEHTSKEVIRCVNMSTPGPHVFLFVIQIARFTAEEIDTFNRLFDLFGDGIGNFAIITFTRLDYLEREQITIEKYMEKAPQKLKDLLNRCHGRYITIDNKASEKKKAAKVNNLIQLVEAIVNKNSGKCYTNEMYSEAEAALQRKIKEVEEEKAREKKEEIDQIQSKFTHQIDSIKKDRDKLANEVSSYQIAQRQFLREKEKAQQEIKRMKDEMKKIDKKRNGEIYLIEKKEKEEKEKQARDLEQKERQHMQLLQNMQQQQTETNRRYQEMKRQKELQLSKVTEHHNKRMEAEIQRIVDGSNEKYKNMMQALEAKEGFEKYQEQMAKQILKMQEIMLEKDKEFLKQQDENRKRMEQKDISNETLRDQLDDQKRSVDATRDIILQKQKERDQRQREEYQELKRQYERAQEKMKSKGCMQS